MLITEIQNDFDLRYKALPRTPGLHVSQIIADVASKVGYLKHEDQEELDWTLAKYRLTHGTDVSRMFPPVFYRVMMGLSFEEWLGPQLDINYHSLGEVQKDGIIGTPDGLSFNPTTGEAVLHELKLTWKSSRSDRESPTQRLGREFMWLCQCKAYCMMASCPGMEVYTAQLHVYWVNGNYRGSGPEYRRYQLDFLPQELVNNWRIITYAAPGCEPEGL